MAGTNFVVKSCVGQAPGTLLTSAPGVHAVDISSVALSSHSQRGGRQYRWQAIHLAAVGLGSAVLVRQRHSRHRSHFDHRRGVAVALLAARRTTSRQERRPASSRYEWEDDDSDEEDDEDEDMMSLKWRNRRTKDEVLGDLRDETSKNVEDRRSQLEESTNIDFQAASRAFNRRIVPLWPGVEDTMDTFGNLVVPTSLKEDLEMRGISEPSDIQKSAFEPIVEGRHVILHAPTGSGKTLSYLLPMLARLQPTLHLGQQTLILVPTPELAIQIGVELTRLFEVICGVKRVCWFNPQVTRELACAVLLSRRALWDAMRQDTAVLVSTPGLILSELQAVQQQGRMYGETMAYFLCSNLSCVIMDEVDRLFPAQARGKPSAIEGASERVMAFLFDVVKQRYRNRPVQLIAVSATAASIKVHKAFDDLLYLKWPKRRDAARRGTPVLIQEGVQKSADGAARWVQIPETITHCVASVSEEADADRFNRERLTLAIKIAQKLTGSTLMFMPKSIALDSAVTLLQEAGVPARKYRTAIGLGLDTEQLKDPEVQANLYTKEDVQNKAAVIQAAYAIQKSRELAEELAAGGTQVFVAKAEDGRGVDIQGVTNVVLLYCPAKGVQYTHLAGRTGRMGRSGNVISIVTPQEEISIIREIERWLGTTFKAWDAEKGEPCDREVPEVPETPWSTKSKSSQTAVQVAWSGLNDQTSRWKSAKKRWKDRMALADGTARARGKNRKRRKRRPSSRSNEYVIMADN